MADTTISESEQQINYSKIYSYSKLNIFNQCPKQYHFSCIDPIYRKMKNKLQKTPQYIFPFHTLGHAVHNAITLFFYLNPKERNALNLDLQLQAAWISEAMPRKLKPLGKWGGFKTIEEEREAYREAKIMLNNFLKLIEKDPDIYFLPTKDFLESIEDYKKFIKPISSDIDVSGKFDLIIRDNSRSLHVVDFKTSKREDNDSFQLRFYKLLAELNSKEIVDNISFYYLRSGKKLTFNTKEINNEEIKEEIISKVTEILQQKEFLPRPSKLCKFCIFQTFCPAQQQVQEIIKTVTERNYPDDLPF